MWASGRRVSLIHVYCLCLGLRFFSFDLDLPLEVDDEYWDDGFVQPEGKPSSIAYFNSYLGLMDILAYAMRWIVRAIHSPRCYPTDSVAQYPTKTSKYARKGSERSPQEIISELDTAMNQWMDSVPQHRKSAFAPPPTIPSQPHSPNS